MTELRFKIERTLINEQDFRRFLEKYNNNLGWYVEDYYLTENYGRERLRKRFDGNSVVYQLVMGKTTKKKVVIIDVYDFEILKSKNPTYLIKKNIVNTTSFGNYTMCIEHITLEGKEYITAEIEVIGSEKDIRKATAKAKNFFKINHLENVSITRAPLYGFIKPRKRKQNEISYSNYRV